MGLVTGAPSAWCPPVLSVGVLGTLSKSKSPAASFREEVIQTHREPRASVHAKGVCCNKQNRGSPGTGRPSHLVRGRL